MDTKLTLSIDNTVIEKPKKYAKSHRVSLSWLIESYLALLTQQQKKRFQTNTLG